MSTDSTTASRDEKIEVKDKERKRKGRDEEDDLRDKEKRTKREEREDKDKKEKKERRSSSSSSRDRRDDKDRERRDDRERKDDRERERSDRERKDDRKRSRDEKESVKKDEKEKDKETKEKEKEIEKEKPKEVKKELTEEEKEKEKERLAKEEEMKKRREAWLKAKEQLLNAEPKPSEIAQMELEQSGENKTQEETKEVQSTEGKALVLENGESTEQQDVTMEDSEFPHKKGVGHKSAELLAADDELRDDENDIVETKPEMAPDEVDPLDAFMNHLQQEIVEPVSKPTKRLTPKPQQSQKHSAPEEEDISDGDDNSADGPKKKLKVKMIPAVDHSKMTYASFKKNFYIEVPEMSKLTRDEVQDMREELGIVVKGKIPAPIKTFNQCGLSDRILKILEKQGYTKPTPIQAQAIPAIMLGKDVIGCAPTGSGKTLAFLLPMFRHILDQAPLEPGDGPIGVIMAPTRELALQIHTECKKFTKILNLHCVCVYGGSGVASQIAELKRGAEIIVCTPGRMIDVLSLNNGKITNLKRVTYLVLDEADRMFDAGFEHQIMRMINNIRPNRQTVMFSATFPHQMEMVARQARNTKPVEITVGHRSSVNSDVEQIIEVRSQETKFKRLLEFVKQYEDKGNILIFANTQEDVDRVYNDLIKAGYAALSLHGGKEQEERDFTIDDFKRKVKTIMVATSVAARGLDVEDLKLVVNYDVPNHLEDYVHRAGRTGRAGNKGTAVTFVTPEEERFAPILMKALERSNVPVPEDLRKLSDAFAAKKAAGIAVQTPGTGFSGKGYQFNEAEAQKREEERKRQKRAYGIEVEEEEQEYIDEDEEGEPIMPSTTPQTSSSSSSKLSVTPSANAKGVTQQSILQKISDIIEKAKPKNGPSDYFSEDLEINDYPQMARWRVTRKEALQGITEWTGASITTKGAYVQPGRNPPPGERKLYLCIEGPDGNSVRMAKLELLRILDETEITTPDKGGKYRI